MYVHPVEGTPQVHRVFMSGTCINSVDCPCRPLPMWDVASRSVLFIHEPEKYYEMTQDVELGKALSEMD